MQRKIEKTEKEEKWGEANEKKGHSKMNLWQSAEIEEGRHETFLLRLAAEAFLYSRC